MFYDVFGNKIGHGNYNGKSISFLGDSISTYAGFIPAGQNAAYDGTTFGVKSVEETWWKRLITSLGASLELNNSWAGSRVAFSKKDGSDGCERCENLGDAPDVIIVWMGINDFFNNIPLGSYNGTGDFPTDNTTFREAYAIMLQKIMVKYPLAEVWVCTLPWCEHIGESGFPEKNTSGVSQADFSDAIRELADLFGVNVLEHAKCGLHYYNIEHYASDGIHPNAAGHALLADNDIRQMAGG